MKATSSVGDNNGSVIYLRIQEMAAEVKKYF
jgi:hypothetical protein